MTELQDKAIKERITYWDNLKGILISLVVFGHFLWAYWGWGYTSSLISFIYFFHMPAFAFVSGFFSKSDRSKSRLSLFKFAIIYIIFNTIIMIFSSIYFNTSFQFITPCYSYWYLISLIVWRMTIKYVAKIKDILLIGFIAAFFIGFWNDVTNVLAISRTIVFYPFFIIGYKISAEKLNYFINNRKLSDYGQGIILLLSAIYLSSLFIHHCTWLNTANLLMNRYNSSFDLYIRIIIFIIAGLMITSIIFLTPNKALLFLCKWGKNSLSIFILHRFITLVFIKFFPANNYTDYYIIGASLASIITLCILGSDLVSDKFNLIISKATNTILFCLHKQNSYQRNIAREIPGVLIIIFLLLPILTTTIKPTVKPTPESINKPTDKIHKIMTKEQEAAIRDSMSIAFVGDLILLQDQVIAKILSKKQNAHFVLISPWLALDNDPYTAISIKERDLLLEEFGKVLELYCKQKGYCYINPNPSINEIFLKYPPSDYLIDHIHPNASTGISLYSKVVLSN